MTPEEHFAKAERRLALFNERFAEDDEAPLSAELHIALGRALSEHEARKEDGCGCRSYGRKHCVAHAHLEFGEPPSPHSWQTNRTAAHELDIVALNNEINARTAELGTVKRQLEQKDRDLSDLQAGYDGVAKSWTERGGRILKLEQQVRELRARLRATAANELVLETRERQVTEQESQIEGLRTQVKALGDKLYDANEFRAQCEQLAKENDRLAQDVQSRDASITQLLLKLETADQVARNLRSEIEAGREISDNNARALFAANEAAANEAADQLALIAVGPPAALLGPETVTVDFGGNGLGSKSRRIYGALRPAEQVWRTPEITLWRGLRGRWAVEASTPDAVEVFVRSVDYPDTDEVGVDLVTWPKDCAPGSVGHNRMEILSRQRMSRKAWATHPDNIGDMEHP